MQGRAKCMTNTCIFSQVYLYEIILYQLNFYSLFSDAVRHRDVDEHILWFRIISLTQFKTQWQPCSWNRILFSRCLLLFDCRVSLLCLEGQTTSLFKITVSTLFHRGRKLYHRETFSPHTIHSNIIVFCRTWNWQSAKCLVTLTPLPVSILQLTRTQEIAVLFPRAILGTLGKCSTLVHSKRKGSMQREKARSSVNTTSSIKIVANYELQEEVIILPLA